MLSNNKIFVNDFISPLRNCDCSLDAQRHYNGIIDDARLYNRALTEQEINAIIQKHCFTVFLFVAIPTRLGRVLNTGISLQSE
ncbi:MAG: hypothetical protein AAB243_04680 [Planctomycetota bacterium]|jgi:hypothetical protein